MLTRRAVLKCGLVAVGAALLPSKATRSSADVRLPNLQLTPFADPLPFPPDHTPVGSLDPSPNPAVHQYFDFADQVLDLPPLAPLLYEVYQKEALHKFHRDLPNTLIWGYNGLLPGPTFRVYQLTQATYREVHARPVLVRFYNNLPKDHTGFGVPVTTIHFHGGHQEPYSDGFPGALADIASCKGQLERFFAPFPPGGAFEPGAFFDYYLPMRDPGFSFGRHEADDRAATMWYHDHFLDFTGPNVYKGLAGFFLVFDELDTSDETGTRFPGTNLRLPSGAFDVPLVIQDKTFDAQGRLLFDTFEHDGFLGNQFVVNGKIQPYFEVQRRKYRFRLLNGSNARVYQLFLSQAPNSTTVFHFDQIATEGGLLSKPIRGIDNFRLHPAERVEVVIDFADPQFKGVTEAFFENRLQQDNGRGPDGLGAGTPLLQFRLQDERPIDPSRVPDTLRRHDALTQAELAGVTRRTFAFERSNGAWAINGQFVDLCSPLAQIPVNATERWRLVNKSGGWVHPVHIHLEFLHVLSRNGEVPPLNERDGMALKETIYLGPNDAVEVAFHFRDFTGPYVFHCHNLEHEDMAMMAAFNVHAV